MAFNKKAKKADLSREDQCIEEKKFAFSAEKIT